MTQQETLSDLRPCPVCSQEMWIDASHCPGCGWINKSRPSKGRWSGFINNCQMAYRYVFTAEKGKMSPSDQLSMYIGLVIGVLLSAHLRGTRETTTVIFACAIALVIAPVAYEKLKVAPEAPFIAKFGLFVQSGVFWDILFEAIGSKLAGGG